MNYKKWRFLDNLYYIIELVWIFLILFLFGLIAEQSFCKSILIKFIIVFCCIFSFCILLYLHERNTKKIGIMEERLKLKWNINNLKSILLDYLRTENFSKIFLNNKFEIFEKEFRNDKNNCLRRIRYICIFMNKCNQINEHLNKLMSDLRKELKVKKRDHYYINYLVFFTDKVDDSLLSYLTANTYINTLSVRAMPIDSIYSGILPVCISEKDNSIYFAKCYEYPPSFEHFKKEFLSNINENRI